MAAPSGDANTRRRSGISSETTARAAALAQLKNLKQQGGRRLDSFQPRMEERIYDTLPEEDYARLVAKRREAAKDFVVEDEGLGYGDIGEEEDWEVDVRPESSDEEDNGCSKKKKSSLKPADLKRKDAPNRKAASLSAAAALLGRQRVSSMFAAASGASRRPRDEMFGGGVTPDNILEDVLADITAEDVAREREGRKRRAAAGLNKLAMNVLPVIQSCPESQQNFGQPNKAYMGMMSSKSPQGPECGTFHQEINNERTLHKVPDNKHQITGQEISSDSGTLHKAPDNKHQITGLQISSGLSITSENNGNKQDHSYESDPLMEAVYTTTKKDIANEQTDLKVTSDEPSLSNEQEVEIKPKLNAKIVKSDTSLEKASAGWMAVCESGTDKKMKSEVIEEVTPSGDDGALQLDSSRTFQFFLIDAYEEAFGANPGTIYLFGKSLSGTKYISCCVVVRNMQRCIYAVPAPSVFPSNTIAELEQEASSGDSDKNATLNNKLQELATGLKKELAQKLMDMDVVNFSMAPVKRSYAFERSDVPAGEGYYLKLSYPFKDAPLPAEMKGLHFTSLFGTHTSALELFFIKRKIRGPCWLSVRNPVSSTSSSQVSWCKLEVIVDSPKDVMVAPSGKIPHELPPVIVAAINLKTVINHKQNINEIVSASVVYCRKVKVDMPMPQSEWNTHDMLSHFSIVRKLEGGIFPVGFTSEVSQINTKAGTNVLSLESSERALLNHLMIKLHQLDPDVLVGHNISGFDLDVLLHRVQACKVPNNIWSKIGRLKRSMMPRLGGGGATFGAGAGPGHLACIAGRILCDTYLSSRDLLKEVSYTLTHLSKSQLGRERKELAPIEIRTMFHSSTSLLELVECAETDAWLALGLMFHLSVLPLTRQLTNISGNLWGKTLQGARAQRVEYLLLHEFHARKFIVPDKISARDKEQVAQKRKIPQAKGNEEVDGCDVDGEEALSVDAGKRKKVPAYAGGLVLEPKKGLYDKYILLLDFNSLYPSIIQEYNVCFTTVQRPLDGSIPPLPSTDTTGILPQVLKSLVERRRQVKQWLKRTTDPLKHQQLDIQQQALKLTANSMYGCLGFSNSRFYAKPIAELITSQGREILQSTVDLVQNSLNLEVIYGDTDSIMVHTGLEDLLIARSIAVKVIKEVNKKYKLLEIDLDGIFKRMLLLKKKKYAAVKVETNVDGSFREVIEQKGLDIVRRDWSMLSKEIGNFCLEQILSGSSREDVVEAIHNQLRKLQEEMRSGQIELDKYVITKTLTKALESYPDGKNQPHVQVALRLKQSGHHIGCSVGDTVPYIICCDQGSNRGSTVGIAERARHPDELKQDPGNWMIDIDYYLSQQIHPVVSRLCAPIEGTDAKRLADCLGLDSSKFQSKTISNIADKDEALLASSSILEDDDRYSKCDPLQLTCLSCTQQYPFPGVASFIDADPNSIHSSADKNTPSETTSSKLDALNNLLQCSKCREKGVQQKTSAAMLANQVKLRVDEFITRYYDGWMMCDDELCGHTTRSINLRVLGDTERGTVCPNYPRCHGHLIRQYTEVDLYKQLAYFFRLLNMEHALEKVKEGTERIAAERNLLPYKEAIDLAAITIREIRDRCAYRWVQMNSLCISVF